MEDENGFMPYNIDYARKNINIREMKSNNIDYKLIEKLASFGLNHKQLALVLKIKIQKFNELMKTDEKLVNAVNTGISILHTNILMGQLQMALPDPDNGYIGNASMLKHLGNVHLGQSDIMKLDIKEDITVKLKFGNNKLPNNEEEKNKEDDKNVN